MQTVNFTVTDAAGAIRYTGKCLPQDLDRQALRPGHVVHEGAHDRLTEYFASEDGEFRLKPPQPSPAHTWSQVDRAWIDPRSLADAQAQAVQAVNAAYSLAVAALADGYPAAERESWAVQISESRALLADPDAATPWLAAAADERGMEPLDLAGRVVALDDAFRARHGALSGRRQRLEREIQAATTVPAALAVAWTDPLTDPTPATPAPASA